MSDLVERLQQWCADDLKEDHWDQHSEARALMTEAAAEIERLRAEVEQARAEVERLRNVLDATLDDGIRLQRERDEARAEVERLREVAVLREQEVAAVRSRAVEYHYSLVEARAEIERLRWWQREVADGMGYVNQAEGQGGYEVAPPVVILAAWRDAGCRIERAERERDEAVALLRELQWCGEVDWSERDCAHPDQHPHCPCCGGCSIAGHRKPCRLDAFLAGGGE